MATRKRFSKALYDAHDAPAREALRSLLTSKGHTVIKDEEDFYVDLVTEKNGNIYYNEAEVKLSWSGVWPSQWSEVRIPERKTRLLEKYKTGFLNFYIFSREYDQCFRIKDVALQQDRLGPAFGRNIWRGELFYHIPYQEAELIKIGSQ